MNTVTETNLVGVPTITTTMSPTGFPQITLLELKDRTRTKRKEMLRCNSIVGILLILVSLSAIVYGVIVSTSEEHHTRVWYMFNLAAGLSGLLMSVCHITMYVMVLRSSMNEGRSVSLKSCRYLTILWFVITILGLTVGNIIGVLILAVLRIRIDVATICFIVVILGLIMALMCQSGCCSGVYTEARSWTIRKEYTDLIQQTLVDGALGRMYEQENQYIQPIAFNNPEPNNKIREDPNTDTSGRDDIQNHRLEDTNVNGRHLGENSDGRPMVDRPSLEHQQTPESSRNYSHGSGQDNHYHEIEDTVYDSLRPYALDEHTYEVRDDSESAQYIQFNDYIN